MKLHDLELFCKEEIKNVEKLNEFFVEWKENAIISFGENASALFEDKLVVDGFYPYYTKQKKKILFIGRESLNIEGSNYIQTLYECYKNGKVAGKSINSKSFHNLMFYITFAINHEVYEWEKIPFADKLVEEFATDGGISFAFMNLSKLSNSTGSWITDWKVIDDFLHKYSSMNNLNFLNKQIEIINPDIIITMNFGKYINYLGNNNLIRKTPEVNKFNLEVGKSSIQLYDMFHFSAPGKSSERDYFYPLINLYLEEENI